MCFSFSRRPLLPAAPAACTARSHTGIQVSSRPWEAAFLCRCGPTTQPQLSSRPTTAWRRCADLAAIARPPSARRRHLKRGLGSAAGREQRQRHPEKHLDLQECAHQTFPLSVHYTATTLTGTALWVAVWGKGVVPSSSSRARSTRTAPPMRFESNIRAPSSHRYPWQWSREMWLLMLRYHDRPRPPPGCSRYRSGETKGSIVGARVAPRVH